MQWASAIASPVRLEDAIDEAADALCAELQARADLVFCFVSNHYLDHAHSLPRALEAHFPKALQLGCSASGVIGGQQEVEFEPAIALLGASLPGVEIAPFALEGEMETWARQITIDPDREPDLVVLSDPFTCDAGEMVSWLDAAFPESTKIGGVASGASQPGEGVLLLDGRLQRTGAVGIALTGNIELDTIVAQGCRPVGAPMFATRAGGQVLYEVDGRSALSALEKLFASLDEADQALARSSLYLGLVMHEQQEVYDQGDFLIRGILGIDPEAEALAINGEISEGTVVQFQLRDAHTSAEDLQQLLARHQYGSPSGALLFSCTGRGQGLYGVPNHDSDMFAKQMGPVPLGGFFGNGEIGPVHGTTFVHGYTSSFGLFRPKHP